MTRHFSVATLATALALPTSSHAQQTYPRKSVRIIVSVLPGDTCDTLARLAGYKMGEKFGQQFVIDNRVGASGAIAHGIIAQAAPDGYTLGCGNGGSLAILPHAMKNIPYNALKDFTAISLMATNFMALAVGGGSSFKSVGDLVQQAKQNPGKVTFGSNGEGAFLHFATELFRSTAGFSYLHVPFKGFPQLAGDLVSGRLDASFGSFPAVLPFTQGGRVRILGIARDKRLPNYPDIPTISESVPGYVSGGWFGVVGPAGIPKNIVALLNREANAALAAPDVREKLSSQGLDLFAETPEFFDKFIRDDFVRYGRMAKEIGLVAK
jgi:tripartite-type tricarboxylate transporter receptor subunit TctC